MYILCLQTYHINSSLIIIVKDLKLMPAQAKPFILGSVWQQGEFHSDVNSEIQITLDLKKKIHFFIEYANSLFL